MSRLDWLEAGGKLGAALGVIGAVVMTAYGMTEEVKLADVTGVAQIEGKPLARAEVHLETYTEGSDLSGLLTMRTVADEHGRFTFRGVPEGLSILTAYAPGYEGETGVIVGFDKKDVALDLEWKGDEMEIATNQAVFTPDERPTVVVDGLTRRKDIAFKVYAFDEKTIGEKRDLYQLSRNIAYNREWETPGGPEPKPTQTFTHAIRTRDVQGKYAETVELPQLAEGIYIVRAETDDMQRSHWIVVSRLGLVAKTSPKGLDGYVVDIASGNPVPGVEMTLLGPAGPKALPASDKDGMVRSNGAPPEDGNYVLAAKLGASRAFAMFNWWGGGESGASAVHFTTDRTVYRPGDTVQYKGFVRTPSPEGYRLPSFREVTVNVYDPDDTQIASDTRPMSALGGFDGSFKTVAETAGTYRLEVETDGQPHDEYVQVAAYRKPEFSITVTPIKPYYYRGQDAEFKVKATYFTGEPMVGTKVSAYATRSDVWKWSPFDDEDYDYWSDDSEDYAYGGDTVGNYDVTTDANGEAVVSVPTAPRERKATDWWWDDTDEKYTLSVSGEDESGRYFEGKGGVDVVRGAVDLQTAFEDYVVTPGTAAKLRVSAKLYGTDRPASGLSAHIEFGEETWSRGTAHERKRLEQDVKLNGNGETLLTFVPARPGDYYARVTVRDADGREVASRDSLWSYRYGGEFGGPSPKLQLVLNKKEYRVGESATAVIRTERPGGTAWVTVESDDVVWSKLVPLTGEANAVEIPVTKAYRPNVSVEVCYIRDKTFGTSHRTLVVGKQDDTLNVQVVPDKAATLPGGTVGYTVVAKNAQGQPVQADVALSVVDEGVYSVREDTKDPVKSFYPSRWSSVQTAYSFPEIYLDGDDKSPVDVHVRTDFRDTAFWAPSVPTGADGTAHVTVTLPENLTQWRTTATAVTADAKAGKGRTDVVARKPVMVRVSPPAFMVQDEAQTVGASVANETGTAQDFDVRIQASGVEVAGSAVQRVTIASHGNARVAWELRAQKPGPAKVQVTAVATRTGENDGLEKSFPVSTDGPTVTSYGSAETTGAATLTVQHDAKAVAGQLTVTVAPSVLGTLVSSLDTLVDYPYGCVEQTMDRFMPALVVRRFMKESGIQDATLDAKIQDVSDKSVARLRNFQHYDGGFGWWEYDDSNAEMTSLVLEGLYEAEQAGYPVDPHMRDRAVAWAKEHIKSAKVMDWQRGDEVRLAYALAVQGVSPSVWSVRVSDPKEFEDDPRSLAYMVLAVDAAKGDASGPDKKLADKAYQMLLKKAVVGDTTVSWDSGLWYEPTALALRAVLSREPKSPLASKAVRYLLSVRRGVAWTSTRDTAQVVLASLEYLRASGEAKAGLDATVTVGGAARTFHFAPQDWATEQSFTVPATSLRAGGNAVQVQATGGGRAFVTAQLTESLYDPQARPRDSGHGLRVSRDYYRMVATRLADGTLRLVPSNRPVTRVRPGEVLHCRLTVFSDVDRSYVLIEDPALSNAHPIELGDVGADEWDFWWSNQTFLDDRAALFVYRLPRGTSTIEYTVRAEATGLSIALPATVSMMYQPDVRAMTGTDRLEVRP